MSELKVLPSKEAAAEAAAEFVLERLGEALEDSKRVSLAVSGGSTPALMFRALARKEFDWPRLRLFWADERIVGPEHPDSNYGMTKRELIDPLGLEDSQVFRILGELEPAEGAERYRQDLRRAFKLADDELPRFDVLHLGMGADAHTASLFPGEALIADREGLAAYVYSTARKGYRVTLLPGVLLNAASTVFLATGADKAEALRKVRDSDEDFSAHPAQLVEKLGRNVTWFVDRAAAE